MIITCLKAIIFLVDDIGSEKQRLCAYMLQNDRKEEFLRMTVRKMYDMMNL